MPQLLVLPEEKSTKRSVSQVQKNQKKSTLGDLDMLSDIKEDIDKQEKLKDDK